MYRRVAYPRRRAFTPRPVKSVKYSCEHHAISDEIAGDASNPRKMNKPLIAAMATGGMRKAKNFTLDLVCTAEDVQPITFALVYVPEGQGEPSLTTTGEDSTTLYEPNQNVIISGIISSDGQKNRFTTKLARNLNAGDNIGICFMAPPNANGVVVNALLTYSITF